MRLQAAKEILRADDDTVSYLLAGLILGTGVVGTLGGGLLPTPPHGVLHKAVKTTFLQCHTLYADPATCFV